MILIDFICKRQSSIPGNSGKFFMIEEVDGNCFLLKIHPNCDLFIKEFQLACASQFYATLDISSILPCFFQRP